MLFQVMVESLECELRSIRKGVKADQIQMLFWLNITACDIQWKKVLVMQSCPTLCDPMDWSLPGSSVHGILQRRILEWVAIPFSRVSSWPRDQTWVSCIAGRVLTIWATREAWGFKQSGYTYKPLGFLYIPCQGAPSVSSRAARLSSIFWILHFHFFIPLLRNEH